MKELMDDLFSVNTPSLSGMEIYTLNYIFVAAVIPGK